MILAKNRNVLSFLQRNCDASITSVFMGSFPRNNTAGVSDIPSNNFNISLPDNKKEKLRNSSSFGCSDLSKRFYSGGAIGGRRRVTNMVMGRKPKRNTPTIAVAATMPLTCCEMNNDQLITLGAMGNSEARKEILRRHIMVKDKISYNDACGVFEEIAAKNRQGMWLLVIPYKIGIVVAVTAAASSFPLVFDLGTVEWFNQHFVTADVPEPKDLETPLEVGSWAWNWMEPPLGQISFVLLCMQYAR